MILKGEYPIMKRQKDILKDIGKDIHDLMYGYIGAQSFTYTSREKEAERFLMDWFPKSPLISKSILNITAHIPSRGIPLTGLCATAWSEARAAARWCSCITMM